MIRQPGIDLSSLIDVIDLLKVNMCPQYGCLVTSLLLGEGWEMRIVYVGRMVKTKSSLYGP